MLQKDPNIPAICHFFLKKGQIKIIIMICVCLVIFGGFFFCMIVQKLACKECSRFLRSHIFMVEIWFCFFLASPSRSHYKNVGMTLKFCFRHEEKVKMDFILTLKVFSFLLEKVCVDDEMSFGDPRMDLGDVGIIVGGGLEDK